MMRQQGAEINAEHPEGVNALMYGAAGAHLGVVQVISDLPVLLSLALVLVRAMVQYY